MFILLIEWPFKKLFLCVINTISNRLDFLKVTMKAPNYFTIT